MCAVSMSDNPVSAAPAALAARPLGRSGLTVTELGFGGSVIANLRRPVDDEQATATVDAAWAAGVRYFDTAPHYGLGLGERRLGRALAGRPRADYVLSTKVGRLLVPTSGGSGSDLAVGGFAVPDDFTRVFDFSRDGVLRSLESSLRRLDVDRVDIVLVHDPDAPHHADGATREALPALAALREQGVIGAIGLGMNSVETPLRAVRESDVDVVMIAGRWTLLDRSAAQLLDECQDRGVAVLAAAPFNSGLLATDDPIRNGGSFDYRAASTSVTRRAAELAETCHAFGVRLPDAAMRFPLHHPAVASVVAGLRSTSQVKAAVRGLAAQFPPQLWPALERAEEVHRVG